MTDKQAQKLIKDLAESYLSYGRELTDIQRGSLLNLFLKWDFNRACRALTMLDREMPPINTVGYLPDSKDIERFYERAGNHGYSKLHGCPCCDNNRYVLFRHEIGRYANQEMVHDCQCWLDSGRPQRTGSFAKLGFDICDNLTCQNQDRERKIIVPQGSYHVHKHLKNCKFVESVTEERRPGKNDLDAMKQYEVDLPGVGEDKIPF
jgi:hypothetical protein